MARKQNPADQADLAIKTPARVLLDCSYGRINEIVELAGAELAAAKASGSVDDHPDAVKYAEGLKHGQDGA